MTKDRLDCFDAIPVPRPIPPRPSVVIVKCRAVAEQDARLLCFHKLLIVQAPVPRMPTYTRRPPKRTPRSRRLWIALGNDLAFTVEGVHVVEAATEATQGHDDFNHIRMCSRDRFGDAQALVAGHIGRMKGKRRLAQPSNFLSTPKVPLPVSGAGVDQAAFIPKYDTSADLFEMDRR